MDGKIKEGHKKMDGKIKGGHKKWMVTLKGRYKKIYLKNTNSLIRDKIFEKCEIYIYDIQRNIFFYAIYIYIYMEDNQGKFQDVKK